MTWKKVPQVSLVSRPEWTLEAGFREVSASLLSQASRGTLATQPWAHHGRAKQDPTQIDNMNYKKFCSQSNEKEDTYEARRLLWDAQRSGSPEAW